MIDRVDHLIYAAPDLAVGIERIERQLGVRPSPGGQHPDYGTRNALLALGDETYLEIMAPDPEQPAPSRPRLFAMDELEAPVLATWAATAQDLTGLADAAAERGTPLGDVQTGGRRQPDGSFLSWRITDPYTAREDGLVPFLIDWGDTPHPAADAAPGCELLDLRGEHPEPEKVLDALEALGLRLPVTFGAPALIATIATPHGTIELR